MNQVSPQEAADPSAAVSSTTEGQSRSEATRQRILRTAERLFAQHGVAGVSLNTINKTARQKNKNAVHYHFGGKAGLVQAIYDKHAPAISLRRQEMLREFDTAGETGLRPLIRALVEPVAEQALKDGGEHYIQISAELIATNTLSYYEPTDSALRINREERFAQRIRDELALPQVLVETRMLLATGLLFHGLSDHLRIKTRTQRHFSLTSMPLFVSNLVDSICAVLQMPPSPETMALLDADSGSPARTDTPTG